MTAPEYYGDAVQILTTDSIITLTLLENQGTLVPKATIKIPLRIAKELALVLRHHLKRAESRQGEAIMVSPEWFKQVGVAPEDW